MVCLLPVAHLRSTQQAIWSEIWVKQAGSHKDVGADMALMGLIHQGAGLVYWSLERRNTSQRALAKFKPRPMILPAATPISGAWGRWAKYCKTAA